MPPPLNAKAKDYETVIPDEVVSYVGGLDKKETSADEILSSSSSLGNDDGSNDELDEELSWKSRTLQVLLSMEPAAFERLVIRVLRESGFDDVKVTGRSGDGGIDGKGIVKVSGIISFHTIVQCKRYNPERSVTASEIRDFRGAMQGRTDKGIFITTSRFTKAAVEEATRDGAPPLDLINGERLIDILHELRLGISTKEIVVVDEDWFSQL